MSVLRKKPFIEELCAELSIDEIKRIIAVINEKGTPEAMTLSLASANVLPASAPVSISDKIKLVEMNLGPISCVGILVYHSTTYCALIGTVAYDKDIIKCYRLSSADRTFSPVNEDLTADELRRVLNDYVAERESADDSNILTVTNIKSMTAAQLDALKPGDIVAKKTGKQKHTYIVSYKGDGSGEGICLTYTAAGYIETVSYDRTASGWEYNSTDITEVPNIESFFTSISGYDSTKVQTLKNVSGNLTWVDDE